MRIAVDAFGGDNAPDEVIKGSIKAVSEVDCEVILVGDEETIKNKLSAFGYAGDKISVKHASEVIDFNESPTEAIAKKRDSSLVVAIKMCKDGEADAVVSAGSTGAYLAGAFRYLGRIKGIKRPALTAFVPNINGGVSVMVDVGANADCRPEFLDQFAVMGSLYAERVLKKYNPKVYLLNNGTEEHKGNEVTQKAHQLLKENEKINFCGNIESSDTINGIADVIVCDGFTGNAVIKSIEGTAKTLFKLIKKSFMNNLLTKISAVVMKPHLKDLKSMLDSSEIGGVPLLGVDGVVIKAHGNANEKAFCNAIKSAVTFSETGLNDELKAYLCQKEEIEE